MADETPLRAFVQRWQVPLVAGGVVLLAALLAGAYFLWFRQPYAVLFKDLRTADAATIVADLEKRKTPYQLADGGREIRVPKAVVDSTRLAVMGEDLPLKGVVGFELFSKSDMGLTEFAQRINYRRALQGEIARTIMALDEVESARVHLSLSEPSVFREDRKPSKASITIVPRPGRAVSPHNVRGIQRLVAAAVEGLEPSDVVVLDATGGVISGAEDAAAPMALTPALQEKSAIEAYYAGRARQALRGLPDAEAARISAQVGGPTEDGVFADWTPAARRFPLLLTVAATRPLSAEAQGAVRAAVTDALQLRPEAGDALVFSDGATAASPPPAPVADPGRAAAPVADAAEPAPRPHGAASPVIQLVIEVGLALVALAVAAAVLLRRPGRGARLTERERAVFANRLRRALGEEGDADAIARR